LYKNEADTAVLDGNKDFVAWLDGGPGVNGFGFWTFKVAVSTVQRLFHERMEGGYGTEDETASDIQKKAQEQQFAVCRWQKGAVQWGGWEVEG
jgi:hypothetical protein